MRKLVFAMPIICVACGASKPDVTVPAPPPTPVTQAVEVPLPPSHPWPATKAQDIVDTIQGKQIRDPYRWLEDETSPEVQAWMKTQDEYTRAALAKLPMRGELEARVKELFYYDSISAPAHRKGRYFYSRKHADKEKTIVY